MGGAAYITTSSDNTEAVTFTNCAFLNNSALARANIGATGGALRILTPLGALNNCTFVGNSAISNSTNSRNDTAAGGALSRGPRSLSSSFILLNCTLANNAAKDALGDNGYGGGLYFEAGAGGHLTLINTVVANNTASTSDANSSVGGGVNATLTDGGHNICSDGSCGFTSLTSRNNTDPRLGSLVYTGGSVPTLSLLAGSPALDAGDDTQAPATDARGAARVGSHSDIGAYERPTWQADSLAAAPDGTTRLLWNRADGLLNLWSVNANGTVTQSFDYGPFAGWTATNLSVGADNNTRLLWQHSSGAMDLWKVDTQGGSGAILSSTHYGPYAGWTPTTISTGADNHTRLLWRNVDGHIDIWNVDTGIGIDAATLLSSTHYGPYTSWAATGLAVGADNHTRLLWTNQDGRANVWNVDTGAGIDAATVLATIHYGPYTGWTATNLSVGADNNTRLLWSNVNGTINLWNLQIGAGLDNSTLLSTPMYGPFPGFSATALSVGTDNQTRLLWNRMDGMLDLWRVDGNGVAFSSFHFGPF